MSHYCILVEGKLFYWRCIKSTILMILDIYLKCLRNKGMTITQETAVCSTNAILQRMNYSFKYRGARMWNTLDFVIVRVLASSSRMF